MDYDSLIILGNGFDLHFGLRTGLQDFSDYINEHHRADKEYMEEANFFAVEEDKILWTDFEKSIGLINKEIIHEYLPDYEELKSLFCLLEHTKEKLSFLFKEWIKSLDCSINKGKFSKTNFMENSFVINFNYTQTVEHNFNVPRNRIYHIHGTAQQGIIFGHEPMNEIRNLCDDIHEGYEKCTREEWEALCLLKKYLEDTEKPVDKVIKEMDRMLKNHYKYYSNINEIYIIGHAFSNVDVPYFTWLNKNTKATWNIGFYDNLDEQNIERFIKSCNPGIKVIKEKNKALIDQIIT